MARIRSVKPELWLSPQVMNLSHFGRLLFLGLITQADDEGRGSADPRRLKAAIFPGDDLSVAVVAAGLEEVVAQRLVRLYSDPSHGALYVLPTWRSHQAINKPKASVYPRPPDGSGSSTVRVRDGSGTSPGGSEGSEGSEGSDSYIPPGTSNSATESASNLRDDEHRAAWDGIRRTFPECSGDPRWIEAERSCRRLIDAGHTWDELQAAATLYSAYVRAGGVSGPAFVTTPANFYGGEGWKRPWTPPPPRKAPGGLDPLALAAWDALLRTDGASRRTDRRTDLALEAMGSGSFLRIKGRTERTERDLRAEFCRHYAAAEVAA